MAVETWNNAEGDVETGITLCVHQSRPGQVIFGPFQTDAAGCLFELIVSPSPAPNDSGAVAIELFSSACNGLLPTGDGTAFGRISWKNGSFTCSGIVRGSGQDQIPDTGFTGTMTVAG